MKDNVDSALRKSISKLFALNFEQHQTLEQMQKQSFGMQTWKSLSTQIISPAHRIFADN